MTMLRLLVSIVAALALSATASAAGPCTQQIARVQAQIDAKLAANAATGPAAAESSAALLNRQPTPQVRAASGHESLNSARGAGAELAGPGWGRPQTGAKGSYSSAAGSNDLLVDGP